MCVLYCIYCLLSFDGGLDFKSICFLKLGRPNTPGSWTILSQFEPFFQLALNSRQIKRVHRVQTVQRVKRVQSKINYLFHHSSSWLPQRIIIKVEAFLCLGIWSLVASCGSLRIFFQKCGHVAIEICRHKGRNRGFSNKFLFNTTVCSVQGLDL